MLDLTKPVQTRAGRPVRILITDLRDQRPVVAIVTLDDNTETVETYYLTGHYLDHERSYWDLVNVPVKAEDGAML